MWNCVIGLLAAFSELFLLYAGREGYAEASTASNNTNLLLTAAAMVDNLAEKVIVCIQLRPQKLSIVQTRISTIQGSFKY